MIFGKELLPKVLDGSKTVTRRPVRYDRVTPVGAAGPVSVERPCVYKPYTFRAVQPRIESGPGKGRGAKAVGRIWIKSVSRERLGDLLTFSDSEANREGFRHFYAFRTYWEELYGSYDPTWLVDRIEFNLAEGTA